MKKYYHYNDGDDIENYLLELFKGNPSEEDIEEVLSNNPQWAIKYHLSKDRENLLNWYKFKEGSKLLEIGAGCGALTNVFLEQNLDVTAVELTKRRAEIIRNRFKKTKNLKVEDGNIQEKELKEKYDYVTLIGVLEYSGKYIDAGEPFKKLLIGTKNLLKKDGELIIAIENKFGLKYWRGAPEDHTNRLFDSLEGYPKYDGIRTFGKKEMIDLLLSSGFKEKNITFYYPIPDYKFCYEIFSEEYLSKGTHPISNSNYPSPHPSNAYMLFDEGLVSKELQKNKIFDQLANSFLIFVKNE